LPSCLSAHSSVSIPTHLDAFQLQLTPFNSTPISSLVWNDPKGEVVVAVILDPFAGEIFSAMKNGGARVNFSPCVVGEERTGAEAVVVTGYGATDESADAMVKGMIALTSLPVRSIRRVLLTLVPIRSRRRGERRSLRTLPGASLRPPLAFNPRHRRLSTPLLTPFNSTPTSLCMERPSRMLGSAAIMLAWVAAGRLTAYYECDLNSWDTAAGALLVREAGGRMTDLVTGEEYGLRTRAIMASNGATHDELRECLVKGGVKALADYP
jgi:hypothetical protein